MPRHLTDDEFSEALRRYRARTDAAREQHGDASVEHRIAGLEEAWYRTETDLLKARRRIAELERLSLPTFNVDRSTARQHLPIFRRAKTEEP